VLQVGLQRLASQQLWAIRSAVWLQLLLLAVLVACVGLSCCLGSIQSTWLALCSWWAEIDAAVTVSVRAVGCAVGVGWLPGGVICMQRSFCDVPPILPRTEQLPLSGIKDC
jgi:hypothetical protein